MKRFVSSIVIGLALLLSLSSLSVAGSRRQDTGQTIVDFYLHGHEDDWQLFMSPKVYESAKAGHKIVFVYATAGDNGYINEYWQARERSAQISQNLIANNPNWSCDVWNCGPQLINGRMLHRCSAGNFRAYFMRIPDGNLNGTGFSLYGNQSLQHLRENLSDSAVTTVDKSATYPTWADFRQTLVGIIQTESSGASYIELNAPDYDRSINPGDHSDHYSVGIAIHEARQYYGSRNWHNNWYVDYHVKDMPINLNPGQFQVKVSAYMAYDREMWNSWYGSRNEASTICASYEKYSAWLYRMYYRSGD